MQDGGMAALSCGAACAAAVQVLALRGESVIAAVHPHDTHLHQVVPAWLVHCHGQLRFLVVRFEDEPQASVSALDGMTSDVHDSRRLQEAELRAKVVRRASAVDGCSVRGLGGAGVLGAEIAAIFGRGRGNLSNFITPRARVVLVVDRPVAPEIGLG